MEFAAALLLWLALVHAALRKENLRMVSMSWIHLAQTQHLAEKHSSHKKWRGSVCMLMLVRWCVACPVSSRDSKNQAAPSVQCEKLPTEPLMLSLWCIPVLFPDIFHYIPFKRRITIRQQSAFRGLSLGGWRWDRLHAGGSKAAEF